MHESILIAGSGGQGILFSGTVLAQAALNDGKEVSFFPSYGAEIRGGTANCTVIVSDTEIGSPIVEHPSSMIILNTLSLNRFLPRIQQGGCVVLNTSLIQEKPGHDSVQTVLVPATAIAHEQLNNKKVSNMVALGAFLKAKPIVSTDAVERALEKILGSKQDLISINKSAFKKGLMN